MIKLKNIIIESDNLNEKLIEFDNLIQKNGFIITSPIIYRGISNLSNKQPIYFGVYDIRTDRHGRDSSKFSNLLVNKYINNFTSLPPRSEILFCSLDINFAEGYGMPYIILPHKDNIIYSYPEDSFGPLDTMARVIDKVTSKQNYMEILSDLSYEKYEHLYFFLNLIRTGKYNDEEIIDYYLINMDAIYKEAGDLRVRAYEANQYIVSNILYNIQSNISELIKYENNAIRIRNFKTMQNAKKTDSNEIWITHGKYCMVSMKFYTKYSEYLESNGKL